MEEVEDENARGQVRVRDFGRRLANQVNIYCCHLDLSHLFTSR